MKVTFEGSPQRATEIPELGEDGKFVSQDRQNTFRIIMQVACASEDKTIDVSVNIRGHVSRDKVAHIEDRQRPSSVALVVLNGAVEQLSSMGAWQFYESMNICVPSDAEVATSSEFKVEREVDLNETLVAQLVEVSKRHREAVESFDRAQDFLLKHASALRYYGQKSRDAAEYVASCMRSNGYGFLYAWNKQNSAALLEAVEEVMRRKDMGHPNYIRFAEKVQSVAYRAEVPTVWSAPPPWGGFGD